MQQNFGDEPLTNDPEQRKKAYKKASFGPELIKEAEAMYADGQIQSISKVRRLIGKQAYIDNWVKEHRRLREAKNKATAQRVFYATENKSLQDHTTDLARKGKLRMK